MVATRFSFKYSAETANGGAAGGAPVTGYSAWFVANMLVYQDQGATTPAVVDGDPVMRWDSMAGSAGALNVKTPGGAGACAWKTGANGINSLPVVRSVALSLALLHDITDAPIIGPAGTLIPAAAGTVFSVVKRSSTPAAAGIWGSNNNHATCAYDLAGGSYGLRNYLNDGGFQIVATKLAPNASAPFVMTWHHAAGVLYSGVNDTRLASMNSLAAGSIATASSLVLLGFAGPAGYMDGDLAEIIFYPTALSESDRKTTETYLAGKYGITLPY